MQLMKRVISFMLTLTLCLGMLPMPASAQQVETEGTAADSDVTIRAQNGFGTLLSQELQEDRTEDDADYPSGYSVSGLTFENGRATAEYLTQQDALLTVAVYTEDGLRMLASATVEVSPEDSLAEVTFEGELPEYFLASAFLMDGYDFSPLCAAYTTALYTEDMQKLLASTVDDYDEELVLNLDDDKTTNFAVFAENTKVISHQEGVNKVASVDDANRTYVIENADSQFTSLAPGDVFAYAYGENECLITKVKTVSVSGTTVTITGDELDMEEVFTHVKIEYDTGDGEITVDDSTAAEGVEFAGFADQPQTFALQGGGSGKASLIYNLFDPAQDRGFRLEGTVNLTISAEVDFYLSFTRVYIKFQVGGELKLMASLLGKLNAMKIPLGFVGFTMPGVIIDFTPALVLTISGKVTVSTSVSAKFGVEFDSDTGLYKLENKPVWDVSKAELEATVFLGIDFAPNVSLLGENIATIELGATVGAEFKAKLELKASVDLIEKPPESIHACEHCVKIDINLKLWIKGKASLFDSEKLTYSLEIGAWTVPLGKMYYSLDTKTLGFGDCPNKEYRLTLRTVDSEGKPKTAAIRTAEDELWGNANENGVLVMYVPAGYYTLNAALLNLQATKRVSVPKTSRVTFTLSEKPSTDIDYKPGGSIGGALGKVETEDFVQKDKVVATGKCGENTNWVLYSSGTMYITGTGSLRYNTEYAAYAEQVRRVVVAEGVTSVCNGAFKEFTNLTAVTLADSVTEIAGFAFYKCANLTEAELGTGLVSIGENAFRGCSRLTEVELGPNVTTVGGSAFSGCSSLNVSHCGTMTDISSYAFSGCSSIENLYFGDGDVRIGDSAFSGIGDLSSVTFGDGDVTVENNAFYGCSGLTDVTFGSGTVTIGNSSFRNCDALTQIVLNKNTAVIGDAAFCDCDALTSVTIGGNDTTIGKDAFSQCAALQDVTLRHGVKSIGDRAFQSTNIREITIPSSVTAIGEKTFAYSGNLENITFLGDAPSFGANVFEFDFSVNAYYPIENPTWTTDIVTGYYGGSVTWVPYHLDGAGNGAAIESAAIDPAAEELYIEKTETQTVSLPESYAIHGGENSDRNLGTYVLRTASFEGLVPGEEYILLALAAMDAENPLAPNNLLYITQGTAGSDGTLTFQYVQRVDTDTYYVIACGASNRNLKDAAVSFPEMLNSDMPCPVIPTVTYGGKTLVEGIDYELSGAVVYTEAGTFTLVIQGIRDYTGEISCQYTVKAHEHTGGKATCTRYALCDDCGRPYGQLDGNNHTGETEVRNKADAGCTTDGYTGDTFCLDCGNKVAEGRVIPKGHRFAEGKCTVCGISDPDYKPETPTEPTTSTNPTNPTEPTTPTEPEITGTVRLAGGTRYDTAFQAAEELKSILKVDQFSCIIVASGEEFADALAGSYLASVKGAPILLVKDRSREMDAVKAYIKENLVPGGTVYLLGGEKAVSRKMEAGLEGFRVKRLGGATRYDTNLLILKEAGVSGRDLVVCTGKDFADSLSASAVGLPILLVKDSLNSAQMAFLTGSTGKIFIIGGEKAVSTRAESQLKGYGAVVRLAGNTRYDTSVLVAETFFADPGAAVVAFGKNFPDGLSGGPVANAIGAPLILTEAGKEKAASAYIAGKGISGGYILGGTAVLPEKTVNKVFGKN